ncbi:LytR/AlgR family response regulator transcription factor [Flavobacterium sp. 245]|uniref:LytR/AlgR family response regulator transcription factor n=1 Tax=Flavobacterium sp. 245 TaxID=2512115 RepID=UPI0010615399|nr:LytTR family DNA-binding domain-containing protein [Flavobacterium sp. 245]TDO95598.1 LytTR family two component transcriptional regulator [Flavobacterium sp. 245]
MKIKAIIIDDDLECRELIHDYCNSLFSDKIEILDLCDSVDAAIMSIEKNKPDLVFLDIEMPEKDGFELIEHFDKVNFEVVFVTGHSNHFIKAIECSALNYLMKPINPLNIKSILDNYESTKDLTPHINRIEIFKSNVNNSNNDNTINSTIIFSNIKGFSATLVSDIIYCESSNSSGKCKIVTTTDTIIVSRKMKQMRESLPEKEFLKVSSSYIINRNFFKSFETKESKLTLRNGVTVKVSEDYYNKKQLMNAIQK